MVALSKKPKMKLVLIFPNSTFFYRTALGKGQVASKYGKLSPGKFPNVPEDDKKESGERSRSGKLLSQIG